MMVTAQDPDQALYAISVAGELTGVDPQMLRIYEARGLLDPARTGGGTRRYSGQDIQRIQRITMFLAAGLNLAGIAHVFALENETQHLRDEVERLRSHP
jgi:DNA-binding transcriptional MerR regulator